MNIEVSNGEIADKVSILMIKLQKIHDSSKIKHLTEELRIISPAFGELMGDASAAFKKDSIWDLFFSLKEVNQKLWDIENRIREKEITKEFDEEFIELARSVYQTNDQRSEIKRIINEKTESRIIEQKHYL